MIVEPDYFGHWKTRMLVGLTQAKPSELCPLKLWAFCQQRRAFTFETMTPAKLKAICEWDGCENLLWESMHESGFVRDEDGLFVVHDWDRVNATLVRNWKNGAKGGRPRRTQQEPSDNPEGTQQEPSDNPAGTDKSRVDRNKKNTKKKATATSTHDFEELIGTDRFQPLDTPDFRSAYLGFLQYRDSSRKKITRRAIELHLIDALKTGPAIAAMMLADAEKNSWTGWYFPERVDDYRKKVRQPKTPTRPSGFSGS